MLLTCTSLVGCADLEGTRPLRNVATTQAERATMTGVLRAGFTEIHDKALVEYGIDELFIAGLKGIAYIDPHLRFEAFDDKLVLIHRDDPYLVLERPASDDLQDWVTTTLAVYEQSRRVSRAASTADRESLYQFMFEGALAQVDPYSRYSGNRNARANRAARNGFIGIGIEYEMDDTGVFVTSVVEDGPASAAGIIVGDIITEVDGKTLIGQSRDNVRRLIAGPPNSTIELTVVRDGADEFISIPIKRSLIVPHTVDWSTTSEGVAVIKVHSFNVRTSVEVSQALAKAREQSKSGLRGVVLDLRGDPGGLLDQAVDLSDLFLDAGTITTLSGRHPGAKQYYAARPGDIAEGMPMVVLVDGKSASSSEITAAALFDNGRAVIVGTNTLGKGSVQTLIRLPNDGEIALTWAEVVSPGGYRLHGLGLLPTVCTAEARGPVANMMESIYRREAPWRALPETWRNHDRNAATIGALRSLCPAQSRAEAEFDETVAVRLVADRALYAQAASANVAGAPQPADSE